jgi:hypothetical protein
MSRLGYYKAVGPERRARSGNSRHKRLCNLCILCTMVAAQLGVENAYTAMQTPPDIKKVATLILVDRGNGTVGVGTGFFVGIGMASHPDRSFAYFVTAKHVLFDPALGSAMPNTVTVRTNKKCGGYQDDTFPVSLAGGSKNVFLHGDPTVDLAVLNAGPGVTEFDIVLVSESMFAPRDALVSRAVREGADVFLVGMLSMYWGKEKVYPICRFGKLALAADEKVPWNGRLESLYLVEVSPSGGNSGAPVFFYLGPDAEPGSLTVGNPTLLLAGVVKGFFSDTQPIMEQVAKDGKTSRSPLKTASGNDIVTISNSGIAAVTPAYVLRELLFSDEMVAARRAVAGPEQR